MATERSLRRQIRELENRLKKLGQEQEKARREMEQTFQTRMNQLERDLQRQMEECRRDMSAQAAARVQALREEMSTELQRQMEELRLADAQAQRERQAMLDQLQELNRQLQDQMRAIQEREETRSENSRRMAQQLAEQAVAQAETVAAMPHEFFCPGQLVIYREHLGSAETMLRSEMFDAAVATADAALAELEILEISIRESQREWEALFHIYRTIIQQLTQMLEEFETGALQTPCGAFHLAEGDCDYWSGGSFARVKEQVQAAGEMVRMAEEAGSISAFLSAGGGVKGFQMTQRIAALHRLTDQLTAVLSCIRSERVFSDERFLMGETAEQVLTRAGYRILRSGFRGDPEQPIDCYELEATVNGEDTVVITFVPERRDGVVVRNLCIITVNQRTTPNPTLIEMVATGLIRQLQGQIPGLTALWYRTGDAHAQQAEQEYKRRPEPALLARKLERKYQG